MRLHWKNAMVAVHVDAIEEKMLERESLENGSFRLRNREGEVVWRCVTTGVVVSTFVRHVGDEFGELLMASFQRELSRANKLWVFMDLEQLSTFGSELRRLLTACFMRDKDRMETFVLLQRAPLVEMAVQMANHAGG